MPLPSYLRLAGWTSGSVWAWWRRKNILQPVIYVFSSGNLRVLKAEAVPVLHMSKIYEGELGHQPTLVSTGYPFKPLAISLATHESRLEW
jgi:hypothetical protein